MKSISYKLIILFLLCMAAISMQAQVTIGSDKTPSRAALLELKTQEADASNITSTGGGLVLPRVRLVSESTLEPFIPVTDNDWINHATTGIKDTHVGLVVYNLNTTSPFIEGLYIWEGTKWLPYTVTANNGLSVASGNVQLGGSLNKNTEIVQGANTFTINSGASTFGINNTGAGKFAVNTNALVVSGNSVAVEGTPTTNAALRLDATDKGFLPPRVALTGPNDVTTISAPVSGMIAYHTDNSAMPEGIYMWNGIAWQQVVTEIPETPDTQANVRHATTDTHVLPRPANSSDDATITQLPFDDIVIPENGSYAFMVRLAGMTETAGAGSTNIPRGIPLFLHLQRNGVFVDKQTYYGSFYGEQGSAGGTFTLVAANCQKDDVIRIYGGVWSRANIKYTMYKDLPSPSSVAFWKL